jgi:alginate O-acetyltransferase complex protein AlgJ
MSLAQYVKANLLVGLLLIPGVLILFFPQLGGDTRLEYRPINELPAFPTSPREVLTWPQRFDDFASDHFPLRSSIIQHTAALAYKFRRSISPQVIIGDNPWLFLDQQSDVLREYRGIDAMSPAEVTAWVDRYEAWRSYFSQRGMRLVLIFIPNKHTLYGKHLPAHHFPIGPTNRELLSAEFERRASSDFLDLTQALRRGASKQRLFHFHDTHWNDQGALVGYRAMMAFLGSPDLSEALDLTFVSRQRSGDLARLLGLTELTEEALEATVIAAPPEQSLRVLILGDSFYPNRLGKFVGKTFSEVRYQHHGASLFPPDMLAGDKPELVLLIVAERLIPTRLQPPP